MMLSSCAVQSRRQSLGEGRVLIGRHGLTSQRKGLADINTSNPPRNPRILAAFLLVLGSVAAQAAYGDSILDGGFESPFAGPGGFQTGNTAYTVGQSFGPGNVWQVVGANNGQVALYPNNETVGNPATALNVQEGSQALDLTGTIDNGAAIGVSQSFSTTPGHVYNLSFYEGQLLYGNGVTTHPTILINLNGSLFQTVAESAPFNGLTTVWQKFSYNFTATGSTTTLTFTNGAPAGVVETGLDAVSVSPVPLPSSVWLMISGLGALTVLRRRLTA